MSDCRCIFRQKRLNWSIVLNLAGVENFKVLILCHLTFIQCFFILDLILLLFISFFQDYENGNPKPCTCQVLIPEDKLGRSSSTVLVFASPSLALLHHFVTSISNPHMYVIMRIGILIKVRVKFNLDPDLDSRQEVKNSS